MIHDGINYRYSKSYGWRYPQPGDVCSNGEPVPSNSIVITRRGSREQAVKLSYGGTYYGYGKTCKVNNGEYRKAYNPGTKRYEWHTRYEYTEMWLVSNGRVYRGRIYRTI